MPETQPVIPRPAQSGWFAIMMKMATALLIWKYSITALREPDWEGFCQAMPPTAAYGQLPVSTLLFLLGPSEYLTW